MEDVEKMRLCDHMEDFEQLAEEVRQHHREVVIMHGKIEQVAATLNTLVGNTAHLKYLGVIAEQVTTVKDRLLDSVTLRRSTPNWSVLMLMGFMFAALFSVSALFLVERAQKENTSILIDALQGRLQVSGGPDMGVEPQKKTQ